MVIGRTTVVDILSVNDLLFDFIIIIIIIQICINRVYIQDDPDELYRPVSEERARASMEQSKAMEYKGLEMIFF